MKFFVRGHTAVVNALVRATGHSIQRFRYGIASKLRLLCETVRPHYGAGIGEADEAQLDVLLESLEGGGFQAEVEATPAPVMRLPNEPRIPNAGKA